MNDYRTSPGGGIFLPLLPLLFLVFLALKLTGNIDWSWWLVTAPLWAPVALVIFLTALLAPLLAQQTAKPKSRASRVTR